MSIMVIPGLVFECFSAAIKAIFFPKNLTPLIPRSAELTINLSLVRKGGKKSREGAKPPL